jgi:hypothetical protein
MIASFNQRSGGAKGRSGAVLRAGNAKKVAKDLQLKRPQVKIGMRVTDDHTGYSSGVKVKVIFFDIERRRGPEPWTSELWVYDFEVTLASRSSSHRLGARCR